MQQDFELSHRYLVFLLLFCGLSLALGVRSYRQLLALEQRP
jgi:hypothetical protein